MHSIRDVKWEHESAQFAANEPPRARRFREDSRFFRALDSLPAPVRGGSR